MVHLKKTPPSFSILVPYHNGKNFIKACLDSLINTIRQHDEIIVLINNSNKEFHTLSYHAERIKYIHIYENLGYGRAVNEAVKYAKHEHIIVCDQDIIVSNGWLVGIWKSFISEENVGAVGAKLLNHIDNTVLDFGIASSEYNYIHIHAGLPESHPLTQTDRDVQMVCSALLLMSKRQFELIGGFYEPFQTLYSDLDLCLRLKAQGLKIIASAETKAYHIGGDYYQLKREYKDYNLKSDVKSVFTKRNATELKNDVAHYIKSSFDYSLTSYDKSKEYFFCNMLSIFNYKFYEDVIISNGVRTYESIRISTANRDSSSLDLFAILGYNIMRIGVPIIYFVDRFTSLRDNYFWVSRRNIDSDIIVDRHANVIMYRDFKENKLG
jgi:GT2 family glycosyltransferase